VPLIVNFDWITTFAPELLRKDLDLGLSLGCEIDVPIPATVAALLARRFHFWE
jgi:3-hydroxyisobutyrate dehydrogenase